jgi:hypothetical protein
LALSNVASLADASGELHFELDPFTPWGEQIPVTLTTSFGPFHLQESFSVTAYLSPVAVSNINSGDGFDLFPNPASGEVFLRSASAENSAQVTVYDVTGKKLFAETVMTNSLLDFDLLPKGIYFYTIQGTSDKTGSRKLVIQ